MPNNQSNQNNQSSNPSPASLLSTAVPNTVMLNNILSNAKTIVTAAQNGREVPVREIADYLTASRAELNTVIMEKNTDKSYKAIFEYVYTDGDKNKHSIYFTFPQFLMGKLSVDFNSMPFSKPVYTITVPEEDE